VERIVSGAQAILHVAYLFENGWDWLAGGCIGTPMPATGYLDGARQGDDVARGSSDRAISTRLSRPIL
jgi:hypothetical protein